MMVGGVKNAKPQAVSGVRMFEWQDKMGNNSADLKQNWH
jgi:hypothetical protein